MNKKSAIKSVMKFALLIFIVSGSSAFAGKSQKWKKRFIQSTEDGVVATESLPGDGLTCVDGVVKLNKNMDQAAESTEVVKLTFPITLHNKSAPSVKCAPYGFYKPSTGETMNSGSISATCYNGHFNVTSNCKVASNSTCTIANGTGVQIFDPATDSLGACQLSACNSGYTGYQNQCYVAQIACSITNGTGYSTFSGGTYGACTVAGCNSGYSISGNSCVAAPTEQCGAGGQAKVVNNYVAGDYATTVVYIFWTDDGSNYYNHYGGSDNRRCSIPTGCTLTKYIGDVTIDHWWYCAPAAPAPTSTPIPYEGTG